MHHLLFWAVRDHRRHRLGNVRQPEERDRAGRMARGAGYGENTAAMIETRGLAELTALGVAAGADPKTFFGLAGVGDLIATCGSSLSRNYTFGANLGKGLTVEEATKVSNGVAEGVPTTDAVVALGDQLDADPVGVSDEPRAERRHFLFGDACRTVRSRGYRRITREVAYTLYAQSRVAYTSLVCTSRLVCLLCAAFRARFGPVGGAKHRLENGCSFNKRMVRCWKR